VSENISQTKPAEDTAVTAGKTDSGQGNPQTASSPAVTQPAAESRDDGGLDRFTKITEEKRKAAAKKRRRKTAIKWIIISVIILAVAGASTYGIYKLFFYVETIPDMTTTSYRGPFSSSLSGYGQVKATSSEAVTVKAKGELLELFVKEGDIVAAGDPLYIVDDSAVVKNILDEEEAYEKIRKGLDSIYEKISKLNVYAPFAGKLMDVKVREGDTIGESTELCTLVDDSKMIIKQYFSYAYENDIKAGQKATVSIPGTMSLVDGSVTKIDKVRKVTADGTILFSVEITINNPGALTKDMDAIASITGPDGIEMTPAEAGKLSFNREEKIVSTAGGKILSLNILEYNDCKAGALLCSVEGASYDEQINTINNQLSLQQEKIDNLHAQLDSFNATAPIDGTVMAVAASVGQVLETGAAIVTISDTTAMVLEVSFDERDIGKISVGTYVSLIQETSEGMKYFSGTVRSVSLEGKYDWGYATFPAVISIDGAEGLYAGSGLRFEIMLSSKDDCVLLPIQAVKYTEEGTCVFVKAGDRPENAIDLPEGIVPEGYFAVPVTTGLGDDSVIEIESGIGDGVEVYLQPGMDPSMGYYY
jgi:multidrug efflux pump subunit AcrA (membrane-fusion protein)